MRKMTVQIKKYAPILLVTGIAVVAFTGCSNSAFMQRMQDWELGIKNPTTIDELETAVKKYSRKVDAIMMSEQRISIWHKILGRRYMDKKMYKKAIECFRSALEYYPENQHLFYQIGVCAGVLAKSTLNYPDDKTSNNTREAYFDLSVASYKRAVEIDPLYTRAVYALSVLYVFELNRPADAITLLEPIVAREKKPLDSLFILGRAYYMTSQKEQAINCFQRIINTSGSTQQRAEAARNKTFVENSMKGTK